MYSGGTESIEYEYHVVQHQQNTVDCAFYASTFAYDLALEGSRDLSESHYNGEELRRWTEECFRDEEISAPPRLSQALLIRVQKIQKGTFPREWADETVINRLIVMNDAKVANKDVTRRVSTRVSRAKLLTYLQISWRHTSSCRTSRLISRC